MCPSKSHFVTVRIFDDIFFEQIKPCVFVAFTWTPRSLVATYMNIHSPLSNQIEQLNLLLHALHTMYAVSYADFGVRPRIDIV